MFIFLHIPKTAGTSFRFVLENNFGARHCHTNHTGQSVFTVADLRFARRVFPGLRSLAGHNLIDPFRLPVREPFYLTFLRDPVARVISHYQDTVIRGHNPRDFETSLREDEALQNLMVKLVSGGTDVDKAKRTLEKFNFVGLTERFELSLRVLGRLSPRPLNLRYRKHVVPKDDRVKKAIERDPRLLELARHLNRLDVELHAFAVREVFPALCARAGVGPDEEVESHAGYERASGVRFLLCRYYNQVFRQLCKVRRRVQRPVR